MQLSQKQKSFSEFAFAFSKAKSNFEHFQKKMTLVIDVFAKLRTPKNVVRYMSKESPFRGPFDIKYGKRDQTLLKPQRQHRYHIC